MSINSGVYLIVQCGNELTFLTCLHSWIRLEGTWCETNKLNCNCFFFFFLSLTETKEEQKKEGGTCPGPSGSLKLCSLETAQKIRKENPSEVMCTKSEMEQAEKYWGQPEGRWFFVRAKFIAVSPEIRWGSLPYIKHPYLLESQVYLEFSSIPWYTVITRGNQ